MSTAVNGLELTTVKRQKDVVCASVQDTLAEEQAIMYIQEDKITELVDYLRELEPEPPLTSHLSTPDSKQ